MGVKSVQFSYDDALSERKKKIKKTWKQIMLKGIESFEVEQNGAPAPIPETTEVPVQEPEPQPPEPDPVVDDRDKECGLLISKPEGVGVREFDVYINKTWRQCPFDEISPRQIFRIRDDNVVTAVKKYKVFEKRSPITKREVNKQMLDYALVLPLEKLPIK